MTNTNEFDVARERRARGEFTHDEILGLITRMLERDLESAENIVQAVEKPWKWWDDKLDLLTDDGTPLWEAAADEKWARIGALAEARHQVVEDA